MSRRLLIDGRPLRVSRGYRFLFIGRVTSAFGSALTTVAVPLQVFVLTRSSLMVGLVGVVAVCPLVAGLLVGGGLADSRDRRRLLALIQIPLALVSAALAVDAKHPRLWLLLVLVAAAAFFGGASHPARRAAIPKLVGADLLPAAAALDATLNNAAGLVGPTIAGVVIARAGFATVYWLDCFSFAFALLAAQQLPAMPPTTSERRTSGFKSLREGIDFLRESRLLKAIFLVDSSAMFFGMPRALFPAFGLRVFHGGPGAVGLLYAAPAGGALVGAILSGWTGLVRWPGRAVVVAASAWGLAIVGFGLSSSLGIGLGFLALAGAADVISEVFRSTMVQSAVSDRLRGRMNALWLVQAAASPELGDGESGLAATLLTLRSAAVSGGLACILGVAAVAIAYPTLRGFRSGD